MGVLDPRAVWIIISESLLCGSQSITKMQTLLGKQHQHLGFLPDVKCLCLVAPCKGTGLK